MDSETLAQVLARFVRDECEVRGHGVALWRGTPGTRPGLGPGGGAGARRNENVPLFHKPLGKGFPYGVGIAVKRVAALRPAGVAIRKGPKAPRFSGGRQFPS